MLVAAREDREDAPLVHCVVKPRSKLPLAPAEYLFEWIATAIGRALEIRIPEPYEVVVSSEFAASITSAKHRDLMKKSVGSVFGSEFAPAPHQQWLVGDVIPSELRQQAVELLLFDLFIHNVDRRADNANLFTNRTDLLAIDHEAAFSFVVPTIGAAVDPAVDPLISVIDRHVFGRQLKGRAVNFVRIHAAMQALTDEWFAELMRVTPASWNTGLAAGYFGNIVTCLRQRRDAAGRWLPLVDAWMRK
jgi:hypothetical protein